MLKIFLSWLYSLLIGSLVLAILFSGVSGLPIAIICLIVASIWSLPMFLIELTCWSLVLNYPFRKAWIYFSVVKYVVAALTLLILGLYSDGMGDYMPLRVGIAYGIPGALLHFIYLRAGLEKKYNR